MDIALVGREEILEIVTRINTTFEKMVVIFLERSCTSLQDRLPYWLLGDIMLVTSIRDAVNTYPFLVRVCSRIVR